MSAAVSATDPYAQLHPPTAKAGDRLSQVALRPHAKASKSGELASMVIKRINQANPAVECVGVCCQKLTEAEAVLHHGGIADILITNQVRPMLYWFHSIPRHDNKNLPPFHTPACRSQQDPGLLSQSSFAAADATKIDAAKASIAVLVDDETNLREIAAACSSAGTTIKVICNTLVLPSHQFRLNLFVSSA
eukprot:2486678-Rhodomonas_salina.3